MSKKDKIDEFTTLGAKALRHKIGSIVNANEIYAKKYARDYDILKVEAIKAIAEINLNEVEKIKITNILKNKLRKELESKDFIDDKKFEIMNKEINDFLKEIFN